MSSNSNPVDLGVLPRIEGYLEVAKDIGGWVNHKHNRPTTSEFNVCVAGVMNYHIYRKLAKLDDTEMGQKFDGLLEVLTECLIKEVPKGVARAIAGAVG